MEEGKCPFTRGLGESASASAGAGDGAGAGVPLYCSYRAPGQGTQPRGVHRSAERPATFCGFAILSLRVRGVDELNQIRPDQTVVSNEVANQSWNFPKREPLQLSPWMTRGCATKDG